MRASYGAPYSINWSNNSVLGKLGEIIVYGGRGNCLAELTDLRPILFESINWFGPQRAYLSQLIDFRTIQLNNCLRANGRPIQIIDAQIEKNCLQEGLIIWSNYLNQDKSYLIQLVYFAQKIYFRQ